MTEKFEKLFSQMQVVIHWNQDKQGVLLAPNPFGLDFLPVCVRGCELLLKLLFLTFLFFFFFYVMIT